MKYPCTIERKRRRSHEPRLSRNQTLHWSWYTTTKHHLYQPSSTPLIQRLPPLEPELPRSISWLSWPSHSLVRILLQAWILKQMGSLDVEIFYGSCVMSSGRNTKERLVIPSVTKQRKEENKKRITTQSSRTYYPRTQAANPFTWILKEKKKQQELCVYFSGVFRMNGRENRIETYQKNK